MNFKPSKKVSPEKGRKIETTEKSELNMFIPASQITGNFFYIKLISL